MVKILMVAPYLGSVYGGTYKAFIELVKTVNNFEKVTVDIITTNANGSGKLDVILEEWIHESNYKIKYFSCFHKYDFIISFSLLKWIFQHINEYKLVHTNTVFAPQILFIHWICQFVKIPYLVTPHGMLEPWAMSYKAWKKKLYYLFFEKPALKKARLIQTLASSESKQLNLLGIKHSIVIPNGIHKREFETPIKPDFFYQHFPNTINKTLILFLGRIDPKKGLDLLAPAFAKAHKQFPQTHLIVAGPDSIGFMSKAHNYFANSGCLDAVTFTGMLTGQLKYAALAAASLYVAPSYSEGFSMSVLEGMASGLPCIITTGCNFPEAATAKAAHVVDINTDAIADALIECLSDPPKAKEMGDRARDFIFANYTWERAAKKLIDVYQTIIEGKPLPEDLTQSNEVFSL
jgi:glycosyltransferase involved in cell wall biosynthesis